VLLDQQSPSGDELSATLRARILRLERDAIIVSLRTAAEAIELPISRELFADFRLA
jgi:hypothetical protein